MQTFRSAIRSAIRAFGYDLCSMEVGRDPFQDMKKRCAPTPTIFDVGANAGQTTQQFRKYFNRSVIHAFEPSPETFARLRSTCQSSDGVHINNLAVGSRTGTVELQENTMSSKSSILDQELIEGEITKRTAIPMTTLDEYCKQNGITKIDILKSDTQGYEWEVLKGASDLIAEGKIHLVFLEINFAPLYKEQGRFEDIYGFLSKHGFVLVAFYPIVFVKGIASWTDALFINQAYKS